MKKQVSILIIYIFIFFIGGSILLYPLQLLLQDNKMLFSSLANFLIYAFMLLCCYFLFRSELKTDFISYKKTRNKVGTIVTGYLLVIGAGLVGTLLVVLLGFENRTAMNQEYIEAMMKSKYIIFVALAVLIAPIVEEIVFRKALFGVFCDKFKFSPWVVLVLSSVLFGLIHVIDNINSDINELMLAIPYITRGIALGYLYLDNDRNIAVPIAVHFLNNLISILVIFVK